MWSVSLLTGTNEASKKEYWQRSRKFLDCPTEDLLLSDHIHQTDLVTHFSNMERLDRYHISWKNDFFIATDASLPNNCTHYWKKIGFHPFLEGYSYKKAPQPAEFWTFLASLIVSINKYYRRRSTEKREKKSICKAVFYLFGIALKDSLL